MSDDVGLPCSPTTQERDCCTIFFFGLRYLLLLGTVSPIPPTSSPTTSPTPTSPSPNPSPSSSAPTSPSPTPPPQSPTNSPLPPGPSPQPSSPPSSPTSSQSPSPSSTPGPQPPSPVSSGPDTTIIPTPRSPSPNPSSSPSSPPPSPHSPSPAPYPPPPSGGPNNGRGDCEGMPICPSGSIYWNTPSSPDTVACVVSQNTTCQVHHHLFCSSLKVKGYCCFGVIDPRNQAPTFDCDVVCDQQVRKIPLFRN